MNVSFLMIKTPGKQFVIMCTLYKIYLRAYLRMCLCGYNVPIGEKCDQLDIFNTCIEKGFKY